MHDARLLRQNAVVVDGRVLPALFHLDSLPHDHSISTAQSAKRMANDYRAIVYNRDFYNVGDIVSFPSFTAS